ncbi:Asp170ser mutant of vanillyl-alcohol oxidase [Ilyonectria sp. MPI-CAGE-AT-0026]|nr:Asp170ser mutant of vanillyl-alcohol oxidase [Ilyonectria sp. MPI-CAGE-AT-0026]
MSSYDEAAIRRVALPPGVSRGLFSSAIKALVAAVGASNVELVDPNNLPREKGYLDPPKTHDSYPLVPLDELIPSAVVRPGNTEEVSAIVKVANKYQVPIWPLSMGRNFGYGGAAPRVRGSIMVDLGARMDKVLEFNEKQAYCRVQPGVTYQMLYDYLQARGSTHWVDVPDLGGGSVLGNAVDRGGGYTPYGDHFGTHAGFEIVLPTGNVVRTGMGSLPNKNTTNGSAQNWNTYAYGFGPYHDGIFTQSNFGIVTSMGVQLMPDPGGYQFYQLAFERDEDMHTVIEKIRPLRNGGIIPAIITLRPALMDLATRHPRSHYSSSGGPLTLKEIDEGRKGTTYGRWSMYGSVYGPKEKTDKAIEVIKKTFLEIPGAKIFFPKDIPKEDDYNVIHIREETLRGVPSMWEYNWTNFVPNGAAAFVSPMTPNTGADAMKSFEISKKRFAEYGFDFFGTMIVLPKGVSFLSIAVYDRENEEQRKKAFALMRTIVAENAAAGYGTYRAHVALMDDIAGSYKWGEDRFGGSVMALNEQLKDALDPNGILAPGKSGIWPRKYRTGEIKYNSSVPVPHPAAKI